MIACYVIISFSHLPSHEAESEFAQVQVKDHHILFLPPAPFLRSQLGTSLASCILMENNSPLFARMVVRYKENTITRQRYPRHGAQDAGFLTNSTRYPRLGIWKS